MPFPARGFTRGHAMFDPEGDGDPTSELGGQRPEVLSTRLPTKTFQAAPHVDGPKLVIELRQRIEPIEAHPSVSGGRFAKHRRMLAELRAGERDEMRTAEDLVRVWI
ncbi:MAG TPA: hypothetical protein VKD22_17500, partial [Ramlibacter sp.]|nr:hypothetical protein [Ramlibacter sp.]